MHFLYQFYLDKKCSPRCRRQTLSRTTYSKSEPHHQPSLKLNVRKEITSGGSAIRTRDSVKSCGSCNFSDWRRMRLVKSWINSVTVEIKSLMDLHIQEGIFSSQIQSRIRNPIEKVMTILEKAEKIFLNMIPCRRFVMHLQILWKRSAQNHQDLTSSNQPAIITENSLVDLPINISKYGSR